MKEVCPTVKEKQEKSDRNEKKLKNVSQEENGKRLRKQKRKKGTEPS